MLEASLLELCHTSSKVKGISFDTAPVGLSNIDRDGVVYKLRMLASLSPVHLATLSIGSPDWNIVLAMPSFSSCLPSCLPSSLMACVTFMIDSLLLDKFKLFENKSATASSLYPR